MTHFLRFVHTLARYRFVLAIQLVVQVASHRSIEKFNGVEKLLVVLVASDRCGSFLIKGPRIPLVNSLPLVLEGTHQRELWRRRSLPFLPHVNISKNEVRLYIANL